MIHHRYFTERQRQSKVSNAFSIAYALTFIVFVSNVNGFILNKNKNSFQPYKSRKSNALSEVSSKEGERPSIEYSDKELQNALDGLWEETSENPDYDARHIYGYKDEDHRMSMLQRITATRILDYQTKEDESLAELEKLYKKFAEEHGPTLNLGKVIRSQYPNMALAAEFKRASPSKGRMAPATLNAGDQAFAYASAGANVISVLTEPKWFLGSLDDLREARLRTSTSSSFDRPAILRKEFIVNKYMIAEAAANGADTVLLIVAVLPQHLLKDLIEYARSLHMEPLVEVHAQIELEVAIEAGAKVIGVNNRNLHTFQMDLQTTESIANQLIDEFNVNFEHTTDVEGKQQFSLCSLSGMSSAADVNRYRQIGVGMCLIGESLMRSPNPQEAIASLCLNPDDYIYAATFSGSTGAYTRGNQLIKVCGITSKEDALLACQAGANLIGIIFVPKSKRCIASPEAAREIVKAVQAFGERQESVHECGLVRMPVEATTPNSNLVSSFQAKARKLEEVATRRRPLVVGVFQNQSPEYIRQMVKECELDLVQLHGKEGMEACSTTGAPTIRVVDIETSAGEEDTSTSTEKEDKIDALLQSLTDDPVAILLDTSIKGSDGGGTGITFDWELAEQLQNRGLPVLIAGGLNPTNVQSAIESVRPWGVDVSSGVEGNQAGKKDPTKLQSFCSTAQQIAIDTNKGF